LQEEGKKGLIRLNDSLQVVGFSSRRQSQEPMAPAKTGVFVYSALPAASSHGQTFNQRCTVIQPLLLMPQTG